MAYYRHFHQTFLQHSEVAPIIHSFVFFVFVWFDSLFAVVSLNLIFFTVLSFFSIAARHSFSESDSLSTIESDIFSSSDLVGLYSSSELLYILMSLYRHLELF